MGNAELIEGALTRIKGMGKNIVFIRWTADIRKENGELARVDGGKLKFINIKNMTRFGSVSAELARQLAGVNADTAYFGYHGKQDEREIKVNLY